MKCVFVVLGAAFFLAGCQDRPGADDIYATPEDQPGTMEERAPAALPERTPPAPTNPQEAGPEADPTGTDRKGALLEPGSEDFGAKARELAPEGMESTLAGRHMLFRNMLNNLTNRVDEAERNLENIPAGQAQRASHLIGKAVRNFQDEPLGHVEDIVIDMVTGRVLYAVLSPNEASEKLVPIPLAGLVSQSNEEIIRMGADPEAVQRAEGLDPENWPGLRNQPWGAAPQKGEMEAEPGRAPQPPPGGTLPIPPGKNKSLIRPGESNDEKPETKLVQVAGAKLHFGEAKPAISQRENSGQQNLELSLPAEEVRSATSDPGLKLHMASDLVGAQVFNPQGDPLGKINDLALDFGEMRVAYAVVALGIPQAGKEQDERLLALPPVVFKVGPQGNLILALDHSQLEQIKGLQSRGSPRRVEGEKGTPPLHQEQGARAEWGPGESQHNDEFARRPEGGWSGRAGEGTLRENVPQEDQGREAEHLPQVRQQLRLAGIPQHTINQLEQRGFDLRPMQGALRRALEDRGFEPEEAHFRARLVAERVRDLVESGENRLHPEGSRLHQELRGPAGLPVQIEPGERPRQELKPLSAAGKIDTARAAGFQASDFMGMEVKNSQDETLGRIDDFAVDWQTGRLAFVVLALEEKEDGARVMIPSGSLAKNRQDPEFLLLETDRDALKQAPAFAPGRTLPPAWGAQSNQAEIALKDQGESDQSGRSSIRTEDHHLQQQIRRGIMLDEELAPLMDQIQIEVQGDVVTLRGKVETEGDKERLIKRVDELAGNRHVEVEIETGISESQTEP